ncbi:MAG: class I SAM-dependent methyltransferase [Theionarchaea archaeon]|nr:MAG: hypothetical protein AYK18_12060 [Theionarchaea archaeon DG-70]MBU7010248.1 class I SAM-dependent methyltransferase [Theionarchaea archaeon]
MKNKFMTDEEYEECFVDFWGIRSKIANYLTAYGLTPGVRVLDVPAGHGFLSYEIARVVHGTVYAVGLLNDVNTFKKFVRSSKERFEKKYLDLITYCTADAAALPFLCETFDFVVNFLGLEDINMTRGETGVKKSLSEFQRVITPGGIVQVTLCLEGDEPDQIIAKEVMKYLGCNAIFYPKEFYVQELKKLGIEIIAEQWVHTHRKMTAAQAEEELRFACEETPKIFKEFDVHTVSFEELWQKVGERIETHGMAYYSDLLVLVGQKR